jgi:hypothetical protein
VRSAPKSAQRGRGVAGAQIADSHRGVEAAERLVGADALEQLLRGLDIALARAAAIGIAATST